MGRSAFTVRRAAILLASIAPSSMAYAQTTPPTPGQAEDAAQATEAAANARADIVVTGSRVATNGNDQPTPVTVVSIDQIKEVNPQTVAEQLNELPQFAGSQGQFTGAGAGGANGGNPAAQGNVLNLRNFGFTRNLVLFDGHRVAPNSPNGTVDVDLIPQLLLKRVDVVTGGASAVYGSDAITGVINFITDTSFKGLKGQAQAGISEHGDGGTQDVGLAYGAKLGERLHVEFSGQYRRDDGIDHRSARAYALLRPHINNCSISTDPKCPAAATGLTTQRWVYYAARATASFGGTILPLTAAQRANPLTSVPPGQPGAYFAGQGSITPVNLGDYVSDNDAGGGSGSYFDPSLKGELTLKQFLGRLDYDLSDAAQFYVRGVYTDNRNAGYSIYSPTYLASTSSNVHPVAITNPYLPSAIASQLAAGALTLPSGLQVFGINKVFGTGSAEAYRQYTEAFTKNYSIDVGVNGKFGGGWKYELAYIYSHNDQRVRQDYGINGRKLGAALDAVRDTDGTIKCWVNTTAGQAALAASPNAAALKALYAGCVPMSTIFGPGIAANEANYVFEPLEVETRIRQHDVEGFVSGSPFNTWAGPVQVAVSGQYRKLSYEVYSAHVQATSSNPLDCTGLRLDTGPYACTAFSTEFFQGESLSRPRISIDVKEAAIETSVPLLKDFVLAKDLSVSGAYRYTDYSTSGGVSTWKGGVDWNVTNDLHLRFTRSRDIRAPSTNELYSPASVSSFNARDVLLGVNLDGASGHPNPAGITTSGNPNLTPEKADTVTAGFTYAPYFVPGLSVSLDYFDIDVKDAILNIAGADVATQTDCLSSGGTSATCQLIIRAQGNCCTTTGFSNPIIATYTRPINVGRQRTHGFDTEVNYTNRIFGRRFFLRGLVSYQPVNAITYSGITQNVAGAAASGYAGFAHPKWRGSFQTSFDLTDQLRLAVSERWRGRMNLYPEFSGTNAPRYALAGAPDGVPDRFYTNLNVSFRTGQGEFFLNVQNLFDVQPPPFAAYTTNFPSNAGVAPGDDPVGRYFTAGFRFKL